MTFSNCNKIPYAICDFDISMVLKEGDQYNDNVCNVHVPIRESGLARAIVSFSHSYRLWVGDYFYFLYIAMKISNQL